MSIWFTKYTLEQAQSRYKDRTTINDALDIKVTEIGDNFLCGTLPVTEKTHQPLGIMHGGVSCVLAEGIGSHAANMCIDLSKYYAVGQDIHTSHIRSVRSGMITATASPIHLGKSTHLWKVDIIDDQGKLVSVTRLTMFIKERQINE